MADTRAVRARLALIGAFLLFGGWSALYLSVADSEWSFPVLGRMFWTGEIRLFQDEIAGLRLPLPYWVIGLSQLAGPSLFLARLESLAFGAVAVALTVAVGRAAGGAGCGLLAGALLVTHPVVVGFYAAGSYYALSSVIVLSGVLLIFRGHRLGGWAVLCLLWLNRAPLLLLLPMVGVYMLVTAQTRRERLWVLVIGAAPPLAFLAWSPEHLKFLAYLPLIRHLVEPLGYRSYMDLGGQGDLWTKWDWLWFFKRHAGWIAASLGLGAALAWFRESIPRRVVEIAALSLGLLVAHYVFIQPDLKQIASWIVAFAPLWAVVLGWAGSRLLPRPSIVALLALILGLSPIVVRHAAMPRPLPPATTLELLSADAARLRAVVPAGSRVFLLGSPIPAYLAGIRPYPQQIVTIWALVPSTDEAAIRRSGAYGTREISVWLGREAPYALIEPATLAHLERVPTDPPYRGVVQQIRAALAAHFERVGSTGGEWTPKVEIYKRRTGYDRYPRRPD